MGLGVCLVVFDFDHDSPAPGGLESRVMKGAMAIVPVPSPGQQALAITAVVIFELL
jgi:hypothetical protein